MFNGILLAQSSGGMMADYGGLMISKIINAGDLTTAINAGIEASWFIDEEHRLEYEWMLEYQSRYGAAPTEEAFHRQWPSRKISETNEPYAYYVDRMKDLRKRALLVDGVVDASDALDEEDYISAARHLEKAVALVSSGLSDDVVSVLASDVVPRRVRWLWPGRIPIGKVTIVSGDAGVGKTTVILDIIARLSSGRALPHFKMKRSPMMCLVMSAEDDPADTLVPRLLAAGGALEKVRFITGRRSAEGETFLSIPQDIGLLRSSIRENKAKILLIDPFNAFLSGKIDSYRDSDVRRAYAPLSRLAEEERVAILLIFHNSKALGGSALHKIMGSVGNAAAARSVLAVAPNPENEDERILAVVKASNAAKRDSLVFRLDGTKIYGAAKVKWLGHSPLTADDLARPSHHDGQASVLMMAEAFLTDVLTHADGEMPSREISDQAALAGISSASLRRAKEALNIRPTKKGNVWICSLPAKAADKPEPDHAS